MIWKNVPIPETIVFPLAVGLIIEWFVPIKIIPPGLFWSVLAGLLVIWLLLYYMFKKKIFIRV